jgi:RimJ/RimL family protein N-acetyltransferase
MTDRLDEIAWPVRTDRLLVRRAAAEDVEATWVFRRIPEVTAWMTAAPDTLEAYRERFVDPDRLTKTLVVERDGIVVGDLMLHVRDAWAQAEVAEQAKDAEAEIGWCVHPDHGRQGIATEGARALMRLCFEDLGVHRVTATCFVDNAASWRVMEKLDMRREMHTTRDALLRSGEWADTYMYAILAEEWGR